MIELCPVQTSFTIRYLCPYLPLLLQKIGCRTVFPVASGSLMISHCPVLQNLTRTVNTPEQLSMVNLEQGRQTNSSKMEAFLGRRVSGLAGGLKQHVQSKIPHRSGLHNLNERVVLQFLPSFLLHSCQFSASFM